MSSHRDCQASIKLLKSHNASLTFALLARLYNARIFLVAEMHLEEKLLLYVVENVMM